MVKIFDYWLQGSKNKKGFGVSASHCAQFFLETGEVFPRRFHEIGK